jgi:glycosyltransferase involved in cell wall biosynthesis
VIDHGDERILSDVTVPPPSAAPPQALFFGTLARYKGISALLDAWRTVRHRQPEARLVIAGATVDVDVDEIRRVAAQAGGVDLRLGYVDADAVPGLFAGARLLVAPYRIANTSGVIRVAHGFGRPVVVTDVGDLAAAVDHGRTGLVVTPDDPTALAEAMLRLLEDPHECDRLGAAGKAELDRAAAWTTVADQVLEVFSRSGAR